MVSGKWSSLPDKHSWHFLLMLALSWHRKSQQRTSCVHWKICEWRDPESVLGKRGMRWDLKAKNMPFCLTYSPIVASEDPPDERGKKKQGCWFLHCPLRICPRNGIYLIIYTSLDSWSMLDYIGLYYSGKKYLLCYLVLTVHNWELSHWSLPDNFKAF